MTFYTRVILRTYSIQAARLTQALPDSEKSREELAWEVAQLRDLQAAAASEVEKQGLLLRNEEARCTELEASVEETRRQGEATLREL